MNRTQHMLTPLFSICVLFILFQDKAPCASTEDGWKSVQEGKRLLTDWKFLEAEKALREALGTFEASSHKPGIAAAHEHIGDVYYEVGTQSRAVDLYEKASRTYRELRDETKEAAVLIKLALTYDNWGDYPGSLDYYGKALALDPHLTPRQKGQIGFNMSDLYLRMGAPREALEQNGNAVRAYRAGGDTRGEGEALVQMGEIHPGAGRFRRGPEGL